MTMTAARTGSEYVALANLSVPRRGRKADDPNDLVPAGATVTFTDEQAGPFLNRTPPVIARKRDADGARRLPPRALSGPVTAPPPPPPGSDGPRPDPPGSSHVVMYEIPEAAEPAPGSENSDPGGAVDIPPTGSARHAAAALTGTGG